MPSGWSDDQKWERNWWGTCANTFGEEAKQLVYAERMGLRVRHSPGPGPVIDTPGRKIVDIGGGPCSLLLKCVGLARGAVVDPCPYPPWVAARYAAAGIHYAVGRGEDLEIDGVIDEAWIYNVLQHVDDPARIVANARKVARLVRLFEWIDLPPCQGHPHMLTEAGLNQWLGGEGRIETLAGQAGCRGKCYYGVFQQ